MGGNTLFKMGVPAQLLPAPLPAHPRWVQMNPTEIYNKESGFTLTLMFNLLNTQKITVTLQAQ